MTSRYAQETLKGFFVKIAKAKHWPEAVSRNYQAATALQTQALLSCLGNGRLEPQEAAAGC